MSIMPVVGETLNVLHRHLSGTCSPAGGTVGKVAGPLGGGCLEEAGPWVGFLGLAHCDCSLLSDTGYDVTIPPPALPPDFPT